MSDERDGWITLINRIFLDLFRMVVRLNAPAGIGEDRESTNEANGVVVVSLVQMALLNDVYVIATWFTSLRYPKSWIAPVVLSMLVLVLNWLWLISYRHGIEYIRNFNTEMRAGKGTAKVCAILTVAIAIGGFFLLHPKTG